MVSVDIKHYDYLLTNYWGQYYNTISFSHRGVGFVMHGTMFESSSK